MTDHNVKVQEAARTMGKSDQFIREGLKRGLLPFGVAIETRPSRFSYHISRKQFEEYLGKLD